MNLINKLNLKVSPYLYYIVFLSIVTDSQVPEKEGE